MTETSRTERPGIISLISILLWIQAMVATVVAVVIFLNRNDPDFQARVNPDPDALLSAGFIEAVAAAILIVAAIGITRGSSSGRTLVAAIMGVRIGTGIFEMLTHSGGLLVVAAISVGISIFVLWALYDHKDSNAYFIY